MAVQMVSRYGFNALRLNNPRCGAQALLATRGARPLAFWPGGEASGFSVLATTPEKPMRSTHVCWPNFGRLSLKGDGSDIQLDENGNHAEGGIYGQYSLENYGLGHEIRTLPMHGPARTEEWKVAESEENMAMMAYDHRPDKSFPFEARLVAKAAIENDGTFRYDVSGIGEMVTDLAIHTYLTWLPGMNVPGLEGLEFFEGSDWERSGSKKLGRSETWFDTLGALEKHCLLDGKGVFDISYPTLSQTIRYELFGLPEHPDQMVLWANPDEGNFLCMEPVLCERNSLNTGTAYMTRQGHLFSLGFSLRSLT